MLLRDAALALGGRLGETPGATAVMDYAPLDQEAGLLAKVGLADWGFHGLLALRGKDAHKVLQNILSNDLPPFRHGMAQPSLLMTPKGKVVGVLRVWEHEADHVDVLVEAPCVAAVVPVLQRYAQVGKLQFEDRGRELGLLLVQGPEAGAVVREAWEVDPPKPGRVTETPAGNVLAHDALASAPGYLLAVRSEQARDAWDRLLESARKRGGGAVGWHAIEAARVRAGVPRFGAEATGESLPGEAGLDAAISYAKGCFVGQEVVARIKNLGHVNRVAVRLAPSGPCEVGDAVLASGQEVGKVTSFARGPGEPAAIAVVRREHAQGPLTVGGSAARVLGPAQLL